MMKKFLPLFLLTPIIANAECTPSPDCADMGYTETSCSGKFVRCPFDTSKLFCAPCDSIYKYDCVGENMTGGIGANCNNKYTSCECDTNNGFYFRNGNCVCDTSCDTIGNIYYSDASCSSCIDYNKKPIGIIIKPSEIIVSINIAFYPWTSWTDYTDITELNNITTTTEAYADMNGQHNTQIIVNHYGENATTNQHAAVYCYNYAPSGLENSQKRWYLPALGELYKYVYPLSSRLSSLWSKFGVSLNNTLYFWSSSEASNYNAWFINYVQGHISAEAQKPNSSNIGCFLNITSI